MKFDYFAIWFEDKQNMINTMIRNLQSDLDNGYNPVGDCIKRQWREIEEYRARFERELDKVTGMEEKALQRWCRIDLIRRGAILPCD